MTKTEYREYIASEGWRSRRKELLRRRPWCERCFIARSIATRKGAYDQDLHVHHKNYLRVGSELDTDLEVLCARCHEIETFGSSAMGGVPDPEFSKGENGAERCRACQLWAVVLAQWLDADLGAERWEDFQAETSMLEPRQIDAVAAYLLRSCIGWPTHEDFNAACLYVIGPQPESMTAEELKAKSKTA
jgi:hypothetical protein